MAFHKQSDMSNVTVVVKRAKAVRIARESGMPEQQIINRTDIIISGTGRQEQGAIRVKSQNPLHFYRYKKLITEEQQKAGMRIKRDFESANIEVLRAKQIEMPATGSGGMGQTEAQLLAWERYSSALNAISGHVGKIMVRNVCCMQEYLSQGEYGHYLKRGQPLPRFLEAMDDLVQYYNHGK